MTKEEKTAEEKRLTRICDDYAKIVASLYRDFNDTKDRLDEAEAYNKKLRESLTKSENAKQNWRNLARQLQKDLFLQRGKEPADERPVNDKDTAVGI